MKSDAVDKILAQWQRERPELDVSPMGEIGRMARLSKHLDRSVQSTIAPFGLNLGEFDVLATLRRSGQLSPTDLFNTLMISSGTITHRLDRLEQAELVKRIPDPNDRRGTSIVLTDQGLTLIDRAVEAHVANAHRIMSALDESERQSLRRLLRKLVLFFEQE
ncbi:MAG: MarR family transcriptional regulator [Cyanobacteria bacterium SID2]|nr:MarR family transcriptional regulator [Cyanobacteria bacterium SID2]MBP0006654.1 MarR family transcriptional regulator [Cyanobacteria bacterium SBC]